MAKTKKQIMTALEAHSLRDLVDAVNAYEILREDIVSLFKSGDSYTLVYYLNES